MISVDQYGNMTRWTKDGHQKINIGEVTERELYLFMASKLGSIKNMIQFFTVLAIIALISSLIAIVLIVSI